VKINPHDRAIDSELVEYDQYNRNTNDLVSHQGRVRILETRFGQFSKEITQRPLFKRPKSI
jgi:hypothetical protein